MKIDLHDIRKEYCRESLHLSETADEPLIQFQGWLTQAVKAQVNEPTAMNLATVNEQGRPCARMVLLKEVNDVGFVFFSNYRSQKGQQLKNVPYGALTFFWPELERQVRVEGKVGYLDASRSDEYFMSRPYQSRLGAWVSRQSEVLASQKHLLAKVAQFQIKHLSKIERPPFWGGYELMPEQIEFWQGRPNRLHDRIRYRKQEKGAWFKERLYP